jgi:hypothetical protein
LWDDTEGELAAAPPDMPGSDPMLPLDPALKSGAELVAGDAADINALV